MKFAEEFDQDHVQEWRDKYLNYKTGKKLVKALQRAFNRTHEISDSRTSTGSFVDTPTSPRRNYGSQAAGNHHEREETSLRSVANGSITWHNGLSARTGRVSTAIYDSEQSEHSAARNTVDIRSETLPQLESLPSEHSQIIAPCSRTQSLDPSRGGIRKSLPLLAIPSTTETMNTRMAATLAERRAQETPKPGGLRRFPSDFRFKRVATTKIEHHTHPIEILKLRDQEVIIFLQSELEKVDRFFQQKEKETAARLEALREQLHIMRDRRNEELKGTKYRLRGENKKTRKRKMSLTYRIVRERTNSKASRTSLYTPINPPPDSDFVRRPIEDSQISYRAAKRQLRVAVHEYYRELGNLKSYSLLNRMAFRKLNKKYERTLRPNTRPSFRWFNENVDTSHFVNSNLIETHIEAAEDLYTRYFEGGNHKLAVSKLREITKPHGDKSKSVLFNGLLVGVGLVFAVEGTWDGIEKLYSDDEVMQEQTAFLLQIYAGYFLMLYLFTWFCACCRVWTAYKINYPFIFEFDARNDLDWRQLSNFPCIFWFLFGVSIWINFAGWWEFGTKHLFLWYPVILIGISLMIIFLPLPFLRWRSRKWFAIAHWRLLFSGFYPVEFRDFFLGDMYCSLAYAVANSELFFCLYITAWDKPRQCGNQFSRVMGALAAIPAFWRVMQCIRRFIDTKNGFPHLANLAKYMLTMGVAIILAMYRIDDDWVEREIYIFLATITSIYTALWDVFMDFSLLQNGARHTGLRDVLAFDKPWMYYFILLVDPILRFCWIPLVTFTHDPQRVTIVVFAVAFAEVTRRGMWTLFRVENEHCTNIGHLKASRDVPLPYKVIGVGRSTDDDNISSAIGLGCLPNWNQQAQITTKVATPPIEAGQPNYAIQPGRKAGILRSVSRIMAESHKQDFQKRRQGSEEEMAECALQRIGRGEGIELALQEDEESDNEMIETSDHEIVDERPAADTAVMVNRENSLSSFETITGQDQ